MQLTEYAMKTTQLVPALAALLVLGACSEPSSTQTLSNRVTTGLNPAQVCNRGANIEYLANGTRIRFPVSSLFVSGRADLTGCGHYAVASVTQAMLDPRIMQVAIEPEANVQGQEPYLSLQRTDRLKGLLTNVGFTQTQPPVVVQPAATPSQDVFGIVLTVRRSG
jgi:hypothetical protein